MNEEQLAQIEARANAATPEPWATDWEVWGPSGFSPEDAAFIGNARSDVPALVAEVRRLREALKLSGCNRGHGYHPRCKVCKTRQEALG